MFGDVDFDPAMAYAACSFEEQLEALSRAVRAGKVRTFLAGAGRRACIQTLLCQSMHWPHLSLRLCLWRLQCLGCRCGTWG